MIGKLDGKLQRTKYRNSCSSFLVHRSPRTLLHTTTTPGGVGRDAYNSVQSTGQSSRPGSHHQQALVRSVCLPALRLQTGGAKVCDLVLLCCWRGCVVGVAVLLVWLYCWCGCIVGVNMRRVCCWWLKVWFLCLKGG